jgi:hypothetical protein
MWLPQLKTRLPYLRLILSVFLLLPLAVLILAHLQGGHLGPTEAATLPEQRPQAPLQAELVTITPTGFEPAEIMRPQGQFLFAIDNRSGMDEVDMYLERQTGGRVSVPLSRRGRLAWRGAIDLPPGTYLLRASHDQSWSCRITITK